MAIEVKKSGQQTASGSGISTPPEGFDESWFADLGYGSMSEGGAFLNRFRGKALHSRFIAYRRLSEDRTDLPTGYSLFLMTRFHVYEVLDESGYDKTEYTHYWSLGAKSLQSMVPSIDGRNPAGGDLNLYRALASSVKLSDGSWTAELTPDDYLSGKFEGVGILHYDEEGIIDPSASAERKKKVRGVNTRSNYGMMVALTEKVAPQEFKDEEGHLRIGKLSTFWEGLEGVWETDLVKNTGKDKAGNKMGDSRVLVLTSWDDYKGQGSKGTSRQIDQSTGQAQEATQQATGQAQAPAQAPAAAGAPAAATQATPAAQSPTATVTATSAAPATDTAMYDTVRDLISDQLDKTPTILLNVLQNAIVSTWKPAKERTKVLALVNQVVADMPLGMWSWDPATMTVSANQ